MQIYWVLFLFRLFNACITNSYFQADEFWQALEPANWKAFGYGYLTWEWEFGLRSYAFPLVFELGYRSVPYLVRLLELAKTVFNFDLDTESVEYGLTLYIPKLLMSLMASVGDYYTIMLVRKLFLLTLDKKNDPKGSQASMVHRVSIVLTLTNFFNCFAITRSFINSFEMVFTSIALYHWDWTQGDRTNSKEFIISLFIAMFTCLQRPSNAIIWIILGSFLSINMLQRKEYKKIILVGIKIVLVFLIAFAVNASIDYYFYEKLTFPIFRFIQFNFTSPLSSFYGTSPWHFHIFQSVPLLLGYSIPFFALGMFFSTSPKLKLVKNPLSLIKITLVVNIVIFSCLSHKEFRFIYPLQPLFTTISVFGYMEFAMSFSLYQSKLFGLLKYVIPIFVVIISAVICRYNESGTINVMKFLHNEDNIKSVGFLMPCHSTPWQSYLHRNDIDDLWAITCEPPLHLLKDPNASNKLTHYMDESDILYNDIPKFFEDNFPNISSSPREHSQNDDFAYDWPEYLILFEHLDDLFIKEYLQDTEYKEYRRFFNSLSHWDHRRTGDVIVYKKMHK